MSDDKKITINGTDYELSEMSGQAKRQLDNVHAVDREIQRLQIQIKITQTAHAAYVKELKEMLKVDGSINNRSYKKLTDDILCFYNNKNFKEAERLAISVTKKFPNALIGWKVLAVTFSQAGRLSDAIIASQKAVNLAPKDAIELYNLGSMLQEVGRNDEAEQIYRKAIRIKKDFAEAYNNLGNTLKENKEIEQAIDKYRKAINIKPSYIDAYNNLCVALTEINKNEEAESLCKEAIVKKPDSEKSYYNLGLILHKCGNLEEVEKSYKKAISIKPDFCSAYCNWGIILSALGRIEDAEAKYRKAISLNHRYSEAYYNLGGDLRELGKLQEADEVYRQAIRFKPDFFEAYRALGLVQKELGEFENAEKNYEKAMELNQEFVEARQSLGILYYENGMFEKALNCFSFNEEKTNEYYILKCLYNLNKREEFSNHLDDIIEENEINATVGSLTACAEIKYGIKRNNIFSENPFSYVEKVNINKKCDFNKVFRDTSIQILDQNILSYRSQNLLINGNQTNGNLFSHESEKIRKMESIIRSEIELYRSKFKNESEGFLLNWPKNYNIQAWLIRMKSGGSLAPHIHENGWISGAVYINVPEKKQYNSGNFVVCICEDDWKTDYCQGRHEVVDVSTGSIVLFPSSLMHYTIPFSADEDRIVLAFDVVPK